jgi:hypothetical protein
MKEDGVATAVEFGTHDEPCGFETLNVLYIFTTWQYYCLLVSLIIIIIVLG